VAESLNRSEGCPSAVPVQHTGIRGCRFDDTKTAGWALPDSKKL